MAVGKPLHLRLFLEGVEVPVVAAQVSVNTNSPATAAIQVVPLDEVIRLKPRTMVHLFYLDEKLVHGTKERTYRLLFTGETIGFSWVKTAQSRAAILQCLDFSSYWDAAHATAIEYGPNGNALTHTGALWGSDASHFDDIVNQQQEKLVSWMQSKPRSNGLQSVSGLAGGIIHMMEQLGGIPHHSKGINDFFTVAELRCRLLSQITAEENDNTAARLLSAKVFAQWLQSGLQNMGQQVTFRDLMKMLFSYIYYEAVPNPVAKFEGRIDGQKFDGKNRKVPLNQSIIALSAVKRLNDWADSLAALYDNTDSELMREEAKSAKTGVAEIVADLKKLASQKPAAAATISKVENRLTSASSTLGKISRFGTDNGGWDFGPVVDDFRKAASIIKEDGRTAVGEVVGGKTTTETTARLRSQIIRPDCWFSAPPRCNVVFPEQYTQLSYDRIYIQEVTRVLIMMYNHLVGPDALLANRVLAPSVGVGTNQLTKKVGRDGYRALMDHELHTGIVPRIEWMSDAFAFGATINNERRKVKQEQMTWSQRIALFHFYKYRFAPRQASVGGGFNPKMVAGFPALVVQSPFIISRFSETASNAADQHDVEDIIDNARELGAPSHLVGMVSGLHHNIDQNGGTTQFSMHHVREHLGIDDEFLKVFVGVESTRARRLKLVINLREAEGNAVLTDLLVRATHQGDFPSIPKGTPTKKEKKSFEVASQETVIEGGKKVTRNKVTTVNQSVEQLIPVPPESAGLVVEGSIDGVDRNSVLVPRIPGKLTVGCPGRFGKVVGIEVLDPNLEILADGSRVFRSIAIYEDIQVNVSESLPLEEIIRPAWFSSKYTNEVIGPEIYQPFFGCGSIIDDVQFLGLGSGVTNPGAMNSVEGDVVQADRTIEEVVAEMAAKEKTRSRISIERASTFISYIYGLIRARGLDVDEFIQSFTDRPIATLEEILGTPDLALSVSDGKVKVTKGRLGFHSLAVHQQTVEAGNLTGLLEDPYIGMPRLSGGSDISSVPRRYDVRNEKREQVMKYLSALQRGPAFRG